jgi:hypothetical protein
MRNIIFLLITGIAGFMAWLWLQPVCAGGALVKDEAACRATAGFDAAFCRDVFSRTAGIAEKGATYSSRDACLDEFPNCDSAPGAQRWYARPASWCVVRSGAVASRIEPQYEKRG